MITCGARYIMAFGGMDDYGNRPEVTLVRRFDHLKPISGWVVMHLDDTTPCHTSYGLMHLGETGGDKILFFGGRNHRGSKDDSMAL
jgi:hypothetical protein